MSTRTKAELVAAFLVAYFVLLGTAGDLQRWANAPTAFVARVAPCPARAEDRACGLLHTRRVRAGTAARARTRGQTSGVFTAAVGTGTAWGAGRITWTVAKTPSLVRIAPAPSPSLRVAVAALKRQSRRVTGTVTSVHARSAARHRQLRRKPAPTHALRPPAAHSRG
jgi:hypothetical protein